jgi:hypothetical protein
VAHPKDIGDKSTLAIIAALRESGHGIYLPFGENTRCDLVADLGDGLVRVQCKTGRLRNGSIKFSVCSTYGHHRNPQSARRSYQGQVDYFAVYCPETGGVYVVPIDGLPSRSAANLRVDATRNSQRTGVRFAADYEIGRVAIEGLRAPSGA